MRDGCREILVADVFDAPAYFRQLREAKYAHSPLMQGWWHFELRRIKGKTQAKSLDQGFLDGPESEEQPNPVASTYACEGGLFMRTEHGFAQFVKIPSGEALLHIHAQPSMGNKGYQAMFSAVTEVEAYGCRCLIYQREQFSIVG